MIPGFVMMGMVVMIVMVVRRRFVGRMMVICCERNAGEGQDEHNR
jgi:hypothetical protein